jgi:carboxyl-terminal processing protease
MGGVGIGLAARPLTGFPEIIEIATNSPAQKAGLHVGDVIVKVNGLSTTGESTPSVHGRLSGFANGKVVLSIVRAETNFIECVVRRNSWNELRRLNPDG